MQLPPPSFPRLTGTVRLGALCRSSSATELALYEVAGSVVVPPFADNSKSFKSFMLRPLGGLASTSYNAKFCRLAVLVCKACDFGSSPLTVTFCSKHPNEETRLQGADRIPRSGFFLPTAIVSSFISPFFCFRLFANFSC